MGILRIMVGFGRPAAALIMISIEGHVTFDGVFICNNQCVGFFAWIVRLSWGWIPAYSRLLSCFALSKALVFYSIHDLRANANSLQNQVVLLNWLGLSCLFVGVQWRRQQEIANVQHNRMPKVRHKSPARFTLPDLRNA